MISSRHYLSLDTIDPKHVRFTLGTDFNNKPKVNVGYGESLTDLAFVSAACQTLWPRVNGDGNYGTMWGPSDPTKAKFTLDLTDTEFDGTTNFEFIKMKEMLCEIDEMLLTFVHDNQLRLLGRKNLTKDELRMLQIPSVKPKYDRNTGGLNGHSLTLGQSKYVWDGMGQKVAREIHVCDMEMNMLHKGHVCPGDVVKSTVYASTVYTNVGGDKFGISWGFETVCILCQRASLNPGLNLSCFSDCSKYAFAKSYMEPALVEVDTSF